MVVHRWLPKQLSHKYSGLRSFLVRFGDGSKISPDSAAGDNFAGDALLVKPKIFHRLLRGRIGYRVFNDNLSHSSLSYSKEYQDKLQEPIEYLRYFSLKDRKGSRIKGKSRVHSLPGQARVFGQNLFFGLTGRQFFQDQFHGNSRPSDCGLVGHDFRIDLDPVPWHRPLVVGG